MHPSNTKSNTKSSTVNRKRRVSQARIAALSFSTAASLYGAFAGRAYATNYNPLTGLSGWNQDLIAETPTANSTTAGFDTYNGQDYFINGLVANGVSSAQYGIGVPASGSFVSGAAASSTTFQFQNYTQNNALFLSPALLNANNSGIAPSVATLTLAAPSITTGLAFLMSSTNGTQAINYQLNYADGTIGTGSFSANDWFNGTNSVARVGMGRTNARIINSTAGITIDTGQSNSSTGNPRLYEYDVPLAVLNPNASRYLTSITFSSIASTNTNASAIYAVSGITGATLTATPMTFTGTDANNGNAASASFDTSTKNFTGTSGPTTFFNGAGAVTFGDTVNPALVGTSPDPTSPDQGFVTINVQPAGVSPNGVIFNNTYGTDGVSVGYNVAGGAITGPGGLSIVNGGSVYLANANTYLGTTNVANGSFLTILSGGSLLSQKMIVGQNSELIVSAGGQIAPSVGLTDNGVIQLTATNQSIGYLNGSGQIDFAGGATITLGGQLGYGSSFSGTIVGFGNLLFRAPLTLAGSSSFVGISTFGNNAAVLLGNPLALGASSNTMVIAGGTTTQQMGGIGASEPLTAATNGAVPYNWSFGATNWFGFSGTYPLELSGNATNWNSSGITFNMIALPTAPLTLSGKIGVGGGGLTVSGGGTLILNNTLGTNALTGTLSVSSGTVQVNGPAETGTMSSYTVSSGSSLVVNDNSGLAGRVGGNASAGLITVSIVGTGAPLSIANPVTGVLVPAEIGALRGTDNTTNTWAGLTSVSGATAISGGINGTLIITGTISGGSQIQFGGNNNSSTVLSGSNTYTGESTISGFGSTLKLGSNLAFTTSSDLNVDTSAAGNLGTTFDMGGYNGTIGYLLTTSAVTTGDKITNTGSALSTLTINGSTSATYAGTIQETPAGPIAIYFNGTGTQTFGPANNYSGGTTMNNSGTLLGGSNTAFGSGTITINNGTLGSNVSTGIVVANPIAFGQTNGLSLNVTNPITLTSPLTLPGGTFTPFKSVGTDPNGNNGTFAGVISGAGGANIVGKVAFSGNNTYSGGTNLSSGSSLGISSDASLGTGPVNFLGGAITFVHYTSNLNFTNTGSIAPILGAATGTPSALAGSISGNLGLNFIGPGTLVLTGNNTFTGPTNISGGFLGFTGNSLQPGVINLVGGGIQEPAGVAVDFTSGGWTLNFNTAGGKVDTNGNNVTFANAINNLNTSYGSFTKYGSGSLTLSKPQATGSFLLQGGTPAAPSTLILNGVNLTAAGLQVGEASGDNGFLSIDNGAKVSTNGDLNIADQVSAGSGAAFDNGAVNVADTGNLGTSLLASNIYVGKGTGGINVTGVLNQTGGTVRVNSSTGNFYVGQNGLGVFNLSGGTTYAAAVTIAKTNLSNGTLNLNTGGTLVTTQILAGVTAYNTGGGSTFNFNGGTLQANASSTAFFTGLTSTTIGAGGAIINSNGFNDTIGQNISSGVLSGTDGGLTKNGLGTLTLTGTNTFSGNVTVNGGTLAAAGDFALGTGSTIDINGGTLSLVGSTSKTIVYTGTGNGYVLNNSTSALNISSTTTFTLGSIGVSTLTGNITGVTPINYVGPGSLILAGNNTYTGGTTLTAGSLFLTSDASLGTGGFTFAGGALGFSGYTSSMNIVGTTVTPALAALAGTTSTFAGNISGGVGLNFVGPGTMILTGVNTYTGPTNVSGGLISYSGTGLQPGVINLIGGGVQIPAGNPVDFTSNGRTLNINASNGSVDTNGNNVTFASAINTVAGVNFTKLGSGALTLSKPLNVASVYVEGGTSVAPSTLVLNGSTSVVTSTSNAYIGEFAGDNAVTSLDNGAKLVVSGSLTLGDTANSSAGTYDNGILNIAATTTPGTVVSAGTVYLGYGSSGGNNATGVVNVAGGAFNASSTVYFGYNGNGTINQSSGTVNLGSGTTNWGYNNALATGVYNLSGGSLTTSGSADFGCLGTGVINQTAGTNSMYYSYWGYNTNGVGIYNLSGGVVTMTGYEYLGYNATGTGLLNITGGAFNTSSNNIYVGYQGNGVLNMTGGTFTGTGTMTVGYSGKGVVNISGGVMTIGSMTISSTSNGTGIVNLNSGGVLQVGSIGTGSSGAASSFNFNGGLLRATASSTSFFSGITYTSVNAGGAIIDTNGFSDTITANLNSGVTGAADGGLTKLGIGVLTLSGTNAFTGAVNVNLGGIAGTGTRPFGVAGNTVNLNTGGMIQLNKDSDASLYQTGNGTLPYTFNYNGGGYLFNNYNSGLNIMTSAPNGFTLGAIGTSTFQGFISGSGSITYAGPGTLILQFPVTNTGGSIIIGGAVSVNSDSILPSPPVFVGTLGSLQLNNFTSTLAFSSGPVNLSVPAAGTSSLVNALTGNAALTYTGPGTLILSQPSTTTGATNIAGGVLNVPNVSFPLGTGSINMTGGGILQFAAGSASPITLTGPTQTFNLGGNAIIDTNGNSVVMAGPETGTNLGSFFKNGSGGLTIQQGTFAPTNITVQGGTAASPSVLNFNGPGAVVSTNSTGNGFSVGEQTGDYAVLNVTNGATVTVAGGGFNIADQANAASTGSNTDTGIINLGAGSTITSGGPVAIGKGFNPNNYASGTINQTGGTFQMSSTSATTIGVNNGATGVYNLTGGTAILNTVQLGANTGSNGTFNLGNGTANSATLQLNAFTGGTGVSTVNLNGGVLKANASGSLISGITNLQVQGGGAIINTNGFSSTISSSLNNPTVTPDGGLTKTGAGTLTLSAANNYSGGTIVSAGTLAASTTKALSTGPISVNSGASLSVTNPVAFGTGTQPVTLSGGTMLLSAPVNTQLYSNFAAWTQFNQSGTGFTATNTGTALNLTKSGVGSFAAATWTPFTVNDAAVYTMTFTYNHSTGTGSGQVADGISFGFQKDPRGLNALGGQGGSEAYSTGTAGTLITPSEVGYYDLYGENYGLGANGVLTSTSTNTNVASNNNQLITLTYNGPAKTFTSVMNYGTGTLTSSATNVDLAVLFGGTAGGSGTGYLGFGGSTGGVSANQTLQNLSVTATLPAAATISNPITLTASTASTLQLGSATGSSASTIGALTFGSSSTLNVQNIGSASTYGLITGPVTIAGTDTLDVTSGGSATLGALNDNGSVSTLTVQDTAAYILNAPATSLVTGSTVNVSSGATLTVNSLGALGSANLNVFGKAAFAANSSLGTVASQSFGNLGIGAGATVSVAKPASQSTRLVLGVTGLSLSSTGLLDLSSNDMVVKGGSLTAVTAAVTQGYGPTGTWQGSGGITSSAAAADPTKLTALGVIVNSVDGVNPLYGSGAPLGLFDGTSPSAGDILVKYTYYGDANLDGVVNGSDYSRIDAEFALETPTSPISGWFNGDFNYDGVINGSDYTLIDNAFNSQGAALTSQIAAPTAEVAGGSSSVPEPASIGLLAMGAVGLLGRRRRGM